METPSTTPGHSARSSMNDPSTSRPPLTVIIGTGNVLSSFAALQLRERGDDLLQFGLTTGVEESTGFLDVTEHDSWRALEGDERLCRHANFLYTVAHGSPSVLALSEADSISKHTSINLQGLQNFFAFLARRGASGSIPSSVVLITSLNSRLPAPGYSGYCATKAGATMLGKVAALELAPTYRINMIAPGPFLRSDVGELRARVRAENLATLQHPLGRRATTVVDIWPAIDFLLSDASNWLTGCEVPIDGGLHLLGSTY
jgi:NAD(P)-dependent dehydrogenase (short-subunit alcohol dehydrogenase family)